MGEGADNGDSKSVAERLSAAQKMKEKINAMLQAKGVLKPGEKKEAVAPKAPMIFTREIPINDSPNRATLTKKTTHQMISQQSKASVTVRGQYVAAGGRPTVGMKALFLYLTASSKEDLDKAERIIRTIMKAGASSSKLMVLEKSQKVLINLSVSMCKLMEYPLLEKLAGPNDSYLGHIKQASGASVTIRGEGTQASPGEQLHFFISGNNDQTVSKAVGLATNLLETIYLDYRNKTTQQSKPTPQPQSKPQSQPQSQPQPAAAPSLPPGISKGSSTSGSSVSSNSSQGLQAHQQQRQQQQQQYPQSGYGGYGSYNGYSAYPNGGHNYNNYNNPAAGYQNQGYYNHNPNHNQYNAPGYPGSYQQQQQPYGQPYGAQVGAAPAPGAYSAVPPPYGPTNDGNDPAASDVNSGNDGDRERDRDRDRRRRDRDRDRDRDRRRRDRSRSPSDSPPRRKRFSEGPVKRKFSEDSPPRKKRSFTEEAPKRRSFSEEPLKSQSEKRFKYTTPPPPPPRIETPPPPPPLPEAGDSKLDQDQATKMEKGEWVSTGLGRLVNYGDSDSEQEDIEVTLIDKDGDRYRKKNNKPKRRKSVAFLTSAIAYKALRAAGKSIDQSAMEALKELSPADRKLIPPMTNTIKEAEKAMFWLG